MLDGNAVAMEMLFQTTRIRDNAEYLRCKGNSHDSQADPWRRPWLDYMRLTHLDDKWPPVKYNHKRMVIKEETWRRQNRGSLRSDVGWRFPSLIVKVIVDYN